MRVYFKLALITGDNLELNSIFGLVEYFNANFLCRFCKLTKHERQYSSREVPSSLRTVASYQADLLIENVSKRVLKRKAHFIKLRVFT